MPVISTPKCALAQIYRMNPSHFRTIVWDFYNNTWVFQIWRYLVSGLVAEKLMSNGESMFLSFYPYLIQWLLISLIIDKKFMLKYVYSFLQNTSLYASTECQLNFVSIVLFIYYHKQCHPQSWLRCFSIRNLHHYTQFWTFLMFFRLMLENKYNFIYAEYQQNMRVY